MLQHPAIEKRPIHTAKHAATHTQQHIYTPCTTQDNIVGYMDLKRKQNIYKYTF